MRNHYYLHLIALAGACQPFLPPENGYYVNDIRQTYYANSNMNSIQVACKDGYNLADGYGNPTNGTAICQSNGLWNQQFYCFGKKECIYVCIRMILLIYFNA